jgi:hypothetical protein
MVLSVSSCYSFSIRISSPHRILDDKQRRYRWLKRAVAFHRIASHTTPLFFVVTNNRRSRSKQYDDQHGGGGVVLKNKKQPAASVSSDRIVAMFFFFLATNNNMVIAWSTPCLSLPEQHHLDQKTKKS